MDMKKILIIGAGRSSGALIHYLTERAAARNWWITVADMSVDLAKEKIGSCEQAAAMALDVDNPAERDALISENDVIISMLPAFMHFPVAKSCVEQKKHLITASYVSDEIKSLHPLALKNDVILMNEIGLDPGIDHLSAMRAIHDIQHNGGVVKEFRSYCGGLVAPESNDNPWGYKFSWNPRNVILAGQATAKFLEKGRLRYVPYNRMFTSVDEIKVDGLGAFDAYPNRDSISYKGIYGLESVDTMIRGTLRYQGYCKAWNIFVQLGLTDDSIKIEIPDGFSYADLLTAYLPKGLKGNFQEQIAQCTNLDPEDEAVKKVVWTGIASEAIIPKGQRTPAAILQVLLEEKWKLKDQDLDMVVMQHLIDFEQDGKRKRLVADLVCKGRSPKETAMADTVGLPLAMFASLLLDDKVKLRGVQIPIHQEIYVPLLNELEGFGIAFKERIIELE
jgi:saccharopine dehydrogenase-like NADP-dependent oxidoreductase